MRDPPREAPPSDALVLSRALLEEALDIDATIAAVRAAAIARATSPPDPVYKVHAAVGGGSAVAQLPGLIPGVPAYTVKVNAKFSAARPPIRGVVCLQACRDGRLLALLDAGIVTAARTGALAALAADALARPDAGRVGVIGAGTQNESALRALVRLRAIDAVCVADVDRARATMFARGASSFAAAAVVPDAEAVCAAAEIVFVATWPRAPVVSRAMVRPGTHVSSVGADERGKEELARELLTASRLVVDDRELALRAGAVGSAGLDANAIAADIGEVLGARRPARVRSDEVTVYSSVGAPWQDLAVAWALYRAAVASGAGLSVALG